MHQPIALIWISSSRSMGNSVVSGAGRPEDGQTSLRCLIVEDDHEFGSMMESFMESEGWDVQVCRDCASANQAVEHKFFDLVLLDNHLPDGLGSQLYEKISRHLPEVPVVLITGEPDLRNAVQLTRHGLFDYLSKPVEIGSLTECLLRVRRKLELRQQSMRQAGMYVDSQVMRTLHSELSRAAAFANATVLLVGETGSGKEIAARELHRLTCGQHPDHGQLVSINCAAVPADIFEAELFGAEKGAFTGADRKRDGLIAAAQGGTLFLDEITEMPLDLQAKLLRFLESRVFRSLGSTVEKKFTGRIIAATNRSLDAEVRAGRFREDLKFRIDVLSIVIPPLRERRGDIPGLASHLVSTLASNYGIRCPAIPEEDLELLVKYSFPGNVRELRNILERSLLMMDPSTGILQIDRRLIPASEDSVTGDSRIAPAASPRVIERPDPSETEFQGRELTPIEAQEYNLIRQAIIDANGGIRRAAAIVGLSPQSLLRRLSKWPELHDLAKKSGGR